MNVIRLYYIFYIDSQQIILRKSLTTKAKNNDNNVVSYHTVSTQTKKSPRATKDIGVCAIELIQ